MELDDYIAKGRTLKYSNKWHKKIMNASTVDRVRRHESLHLQVPQEIEVLCSIYNKGMTGTCKKILDEGYYRGIYEI